MKIEDRRFLTFTRPELERAMLTAAGFPPDTIINHFSVESTNLAEPHPVVSMSITLSQTERDLSRVGHCNYRKQPGGCPLPNVQCGYPACDTKATTDV